MLMHYNLIGRATARNNKAHGSPQTAGLKDFKTNIEHPTAKVIPLQAARSEIRTFAKLSEQFARMGLSLYPLDGASLLVVANHLDMSKTLPSLSAAAAYLRQIGGAQ